MAGGWGVVNAFAVCAEAIDSNSTTIIVMVEFVKTAVFDSFLNLRYNPFQVVSLSGWWSHRLQKKYLVAWKLTVFSKCNDVMSVHVIKKVI
jgi:hypothetical protein